MPRANRYILPGRNYHLTHRCHDRSFLFRFAKDRDTYRSMLRENVTRFPISVLGYCITSNHTHLLVRVREGDVDVLGRFMQVLEGEFARAYNLRKKRTGAFWSDRYHAVMIDSGEYLWRCLRYIDLNMVRAGVVSSPRDWAWCGYQEVVGLRKRYRVVDMETLAGELGPGHDVETIARSYREAIEAALRAEVPTRVPAWTESLAVGSAAFVKGIGSMIEQRMRVEISQSPAGVWVAREAPSTYGSFSGSKTASKPQNSSVL